jgi:tetratricopeptide (TPR) repeat protein
LQEALADCNEAVKVKPDYVNALDSRGFVLLRMGRYDEAIADYDAALQIDSGKVASLYGRGMAKRRKGDYAGGNIDIAAAKAAKSSVVAEFARYGLLPPPTEVQASESPVSSDAQARSRRSN